jgi:hypothetical protein
MVVSDQCDGSASSRCASHYWRADTVLRQNSISRAHVEMQRRRRVSPKKIAALIAEPHSMKPTQKTLIQSTGRYGPIASKNFLECSSGRNIWPREQAAQPCK